LIVNISYLDSPFERLPTLFRNGHPLYAVT